MGLPRLVLVQALGWSLPLQLIWTEAPPSEAYVSQCAWEGASLDECPLHPGGGCRPEHHGSYGRVRPAGIRVPRFLCVASRTTISLLPAFLASGMSGTLEEVEQVVATVEDAASLAQAAEVLHPADAEAAVDLPSAVRWTRRRATAIGHVLIALVTLLPELACCAPKLSAIRARLGRQFVLEPLRELAKRYLVELPRPFGFRRRGRRARASDGDGPHEVGSDLMAQSR